MSPECALGVEMFIFRKEALHKMAPGYRPTGLLVPTSSSKGLSGVETITQAPQKVQASASGIEELNEGMSSMSTGPPASRLVDPLDDFVKQLETPHGPK